MNYSIAGRLLLASALLLLPALAHADDEAAYQKCVGSVVSVVSLDADDNALLGTGVVIDGGIVTAHHVIESAKFVFVMFPDRDNTGSVIGTESYYLNSTHIKLCVVVGTRSDHDLALLRLVEPQKADVIPMSLTSAAPGEQVFLIGASAGQRMWHNVPGSIRKSHRGYYRRNGGVVVGGRLIEISIAAKRGDSGGPILDKKGNLVGIMLAGGTASNDWLCTGIDVTEVRAFVAEVLVAEIQERIRRIKSDP
jgi:S1-C subfamily serine protease